MKKNNKQLLTNLGLFLCGIATVFSGMLIQVTYHIGHHGNMAVNDLAIGINYQGWSAIHKISIVVLSLLITYHIYLHRKCYKAVITKKLMSKNHQVLMLSLLYVLVAITGLTPWLMGLLNGDEWQRKAFIEVHDKLALMLAIYLILHIIKRWRWFFTSLGNIKKNHGVPITK